MVKWKRGAAMGLAVCLASVSPATAMGSPEFAHTQEEWEKLRDNTMEYGELPSLIHEYNVTVQNNRTSYDEYRGKSSEEISQDLRDAADEIYSSVDYPGDTESLSYASMYAAAQMAELQAKNLVKTADENVKDSAVVKLGYDEAEDSLISTAQGLMNSYHQLLVNLDALLANREFLVVAYETTVVKAGGGQATQTDVLDAQTELQNMEASIEKMQGELKNTKQKLSVMTGWKYDSDPQIPALPPSDLSRIDAMNPEVDKAKALENNYTLQLNRKKRANATENYNRQILDKTISDNEQKAGAALVNRYNAVLEAETGYLQAVSELEAETVNMNIAEKSYTLGAISKVDYLKQKNTYAQKKAAKEVKDLALFQAMENYDWAVKGLLPLGE